MNIPFFSKKEKLTFLEEQQKLAQKDMKKLYPLKTKSYKGEARAMAIGKILGFIIGTCIWAGIVMVVIGMLWHELGVLAPIGYLNPINFLFGTILTLLSFMSNNN